MKTLKFARNQTVRVKEIPNGVQRVKINQPGTVIARRPQAPEYLVKLKGRSGPVAFDEHQLEA